MRFGLLKHWVCLLWNCFESKSGGNEDEKKINLMRKQVSGQAFSDWFMNTGFGTRTLFLTSFNGKDECPPVILIDWKEKFFSGLDSSAYQKRIAVHDELVDEDNQLSILQCNFDHCESFTFVCPNDGCVYEIVVRDCVSTDVSLVFQVICTCLVCTL